MFREGDYIGSNLHGFPRSYLKDCNRVLCIRSSRDNRTFVVGQTYMIKSKGRFWGLIGESKDHLLGSHRAKFIIPTNLHRILYT